MMLKLTDMNKTIITLNNKVRHIANKMNIKLQSVSINFIPSYEYEVSDEETETTNDTYEIVIEVANTDINEKRAKKFLTNVQNLNAKDFDIFTYIDNIDID